VVVTAHAVRFGVCLPAFGPFGDPAVLTDLAVRAEASGCDGVFLWDHLVQAGMPVADAWTCLAAMAGLGGQSHLPLPHPAHAGNAGGRTVGTVLGG
jgi:alkanesulfonate monooxygenase SsuD/methylene tetrahydromethanopterin reductase-like flavin-dependent oxidoreductase (luciferase family)